MVQKKTFLVESTKQSPNESSLPSRDFDFIVYKIMKNILELIGLNIITPPHKPSVMSVLYGCGVLMGFSFQMNTILFMEKKLQMHGLAFISVIIQGNCKFFTCLYYAAFFGKKVAFLRDVYRQIERRRPHQSGRKYNEQLDILRRWMRNYRSLEIFYFFLILVGAFAFLPYPLYSTVVLKEIEFPIAIMIPLLDPYASTRVVAFTWVFQVVMLLCGVVGLLGADSLIMLHVLHICPLSELISQKMETMGNHLKRLNRAGEDRNNRTTREFLHNCLKNHNEYVQYCDGMRVHYYNIFTMEIFSNFTSMCLLLYMMMWMTWFPLYAMFLLMFLKTLAVCTMGTLIEMKVRHAI